MKKCISILAALLIGAALAYGQQRPELTISLNEAFFDSLLDAVFQNAGPMEFSIADNGVRAGLEKHARSNSFASAEPCREVVQLLRETSGVRTAVRFREGRILAPLAFTGNYNPPLVGCVPFSGYADTVIDLEFDAAGQRLLARARVLNVSLNGTGGLGGSLIAKLVQGSIDRKVNPIEVFTMDRISFLVPVRNGANLRMKAASVRHEIVNGALNVVISYDFLKA